MESLSKHLILFMRVFVNQVLEYFIYCICLFIYRLLKATVAVHTAHKQELYCSLSILTEIKNINIY